MHNTVIVGIGRHQISPGAALTLQVESPGFFKPEQIHFSDSCKGLLINSLTYEYFERIPPNADEGKKVICALAATSAPMGVDLFGKIRFAASWMMPGYLMEIEVQNPTGLVISFDGAISGELDAMTTFQIKADAKREKKERAEESERISPGC